MWAQADADELWRLAVAVAIGLIIGAEREQRKGQGEARAAAGVRTFAVVATCGGVAAFLGNAVVVAGLLVTATLAVAIYWRSDRTDPGVTTEAALVLCYGLGALAIERPPLAFAAGIVTAALLAMRGDLHRFLRDAVTPADLREALALGVAAVVILPMVPNAYVGPMQAVNFYVLWRLAVVMMALSAAGNIAERLLGRRLGLWLSGFASGFVSSSATIASLGARTRTAIELVEVRSPAETTAAGSAVADSAVPRPNEAGTSAAPQSSVDASVRDTALPAEVAAASASSISTFVQMAALIATAAPSLMRHAVWPLASGGLVMLLVASQQWLRARPTSPTPPAPTGRPFAFGAVGLFVALVGILGIVVAFVAQRVGDTGVVVTSALAGFVDAHAAAASSASLFASSQLEAETAMQCVLGALTANALTKVLLARITGTPAFARPLTVGVVGSLATTWVVYLAT